jgi:hypothetical protein
MPEGAGQRLFLSQRQSHQRRFVRPGNPSQLPLRKHLAAFHRPEEARKAVQPLVHETGVV